MIASKYINKIVAAIMVVVCLVTLGLVYFAKPTSQGLKQEYEEKLFNTDKSLDINIVMDDEEWDQLLENAINEEYMQCDVEINGEMFYGVGIRPKGNTSLTSIVSDPTTDRYSLKLEFDRYVDGQTCYGLDKLILNNNYADATNMKEALVYDMFKYMGTDASLYNYAKISVNNEYWGVYLALEGVEDSFMLRNYGVSNGELYKPENMGGGGNRGENKGEGPDFKGFPQGENGGQPPENEQQPPEDEQQLSDNEQQTSGNKGQPAENQQGQIPNGAQLPVENGQQNVENDKQQSPRDFQPPDMGGHGGPMGGGGGSDLNYIDDDYDSYSTIWEGEITKTSDKDHKKVIEALKNISQNNDLEKYMDIDNLLRYMAVHIFSVNEDSLSGNMAHNYYLYENNGQLNLLPWDYNLALGGMGMGRGSDASSTINSPIDNAFKGTELFDGIYENDEYLSAYHENMERLVSEYVDGGGFDEFYNRTRSIIDDLVKIDPTAFYTYDEYDEAAQTLYKVVKLRAESIKGQLDGTIPSTSQEQEKDKTSFVDTGNIDLSVMGSMNRGDRNRRDDEENWKMPDRKNAPNGEQAREQAANNENPSNIEKTDEQALNDGNNQAKEQSDRQAPNDENTQMKGPENFPNQGKSMQNMPPQNPEQTANNGLKQNLVLYGVSFAVLLIGFGIALLFKGKIKRR